MLNGAFASTTSYDGATRTMMYDSPMGRRATMRLDTRGRVVEARPPGIAPVFLTYDAHGRIDSTTIGSGADARFVDLGYGAAGFLANVSDALARTTSIATDEVGRPTDVTRSDAAHVLSGWDANDNLTSVTPPARPEHAFSYQRTDLPVSYSPPALSSGPTDTSYGYDGDHALNTVALPTGRTVGVVRDVAGRLQRIDLAGASIAYAYSATTGQLSAASAPSGSIVTFAYDGLLPTGTTWTGPVPGSVTRTYDAQLRVAEQRVNGGSLASFGYDADGLLTSAGALTITRAAGTGFVTGTSLGAVTTTETLNGFGDLGSFTASASGSPVYETSAMTYDRAGRLARALETIEGTTTSRDHAYDLAGRLMDVWENGTLLEHYAYDPNGNRTSATVRGVASTATYDDQDRIVTYGSQTFALNNDGQLALRTDTATAETTGYDYDELGNLLAVALPDGRRIEYVIDPFGRRVGKKVDGIMTRRWLWDGQLRVVAELDGAGALLSRFVYGTGINVPEYMVRGGVTYRIITDRLGSVRVVVNTSTGAVAQRLDYDSFGVVRTDTNPGFQPFGFAGGLYDPDTALVRFGARDYDAETGRWTARDPILFGAGDTNLYVYCSGDSVNLVDPSGLDPVEVYIVSRSIGSNWGEPLSANHHAGILIDLGRGGQHDYFVAQGGPTPDALLRGGVSHPDSMGWFNPFRTIRYWGRTETRLHPVTRVAAFTRDRDDLNKEALERLGRRVDRRCGSQRYQFPEGPNSNTWARMFLEALGLPTALPSGGPPLPGWGWR